MTNQAGIAWQRWLEPIDEFVRRHGRESNRWAIACTYELELATLHRSSAFRTLVLVDAGVLERVMGEVTKPLTGAVNVHGVRVTSGGVFHPKLVLLRAGAHVRVCFGSANLTSGGLAGNLELWTHSEDPNVVSGVVAFLDGILASKSIGLEPTARRSLRRALLGLPRKQTAEVWSSLDEAFSRRLARPAERKARRAVVVSPRYATAGGLVAARRAIPVKELMLCTDQPIKLAKANVRTLRREATAAELDDGDRPPSILHAKAYAFERPDRSAIVWTGSANFTAQALIRSVDRGGNVELLVRADLPRDEWQRLEHDLAHDLFAVPKGPWVTPPAVGKRLPAARAIVTGAELTVGPASPVLIVSSTRSRGAVRLVFEGRSVSVAIRAGRGRLEGPALRKSFPNVDLAGGAATCFAIHELVNAVLIPVVVNVPHVPPGPDEGGVGQTTLDSLAADMLGRVAVYSPLPGGDDDIDSGGPEDEPDNEDDPVRDEVLEKRLDEAKHEGRLDREATTPGRAGEARAPGSRRSAGGAPRRDRASCGGHRGPPPARGGATAVPAGADMSRVTFETGKPHQERAAVWARRRLADRGGREFTARGDQDGVLLADSVGMGKTWEAIAAAALILYKWDQPQRNRRHVLILCPSNLVSKWEDELVDGSPLHAKIGDWCDKLERGGQRAPARRIYETLTSVVPIRRAWDVQTQAALADRAAGRDLHRQPDDDLEEGPRHGGASSHRLGCGDRRRGPQRPCAYRHRRNRGRAPRTDQDPAVGDAIPARSEAVERPGHEHREVGQQGDAARRCRELCGRAERGVRVQG